MKVARGRIASLPQNAATKILWLALSRPATYDVNGTFGYTSWTRDRMTSKLLANRCLHNPLLSYISRYHKTSKRQVNTNMNETNLKTR